MKYEKRLFLDSERGILDLLGHAIDEKKTPELAKIMIELWLKCEGKSGYSNQSHQPSENMWVLMEWLSMYLHNSSMQMNLSPCKKASKSFW